MTRVAPQTAVISAEVGREIGNLRKTVKELIELAADEKRARYEDRMIFQYEPRTIDNFLTKVKFEDRACKMEGYDRGVEVQRILKAINKIIRKQRAKWFDPIDTDERADKKAFSDYFDHLERMQGTVTRNVGTVVKGQELQKQMLEAAKARSKTLRRLDDNRKKIDAKIKKYID